MRAIDADALIKDVRENSESYFADDFAEFWVNRQPTIHPEPHWIPVTERLPETSDAVLTTYIVNGDRSRRYVEESSYYGNDESWSSPWDEYRIAGTRIDVIAWMPKPEPFKGMTE